MPQSSHGAAASPSTPTFFSAKISLVLARGGPIIVQMTHQDGHMLPAHTESSSRVPPMTETSFVLFKGDFIAPGRARIPNDCCCTTRSMYGDDD